MQAWESGTSFLDVLSADPDVTRHLGREQLAAQFDEAYHLKHVDTIFARVFAD